MHATLANGTKHVHHDFRTGLYIQAFGIIKAKPIQQAQFSKVQKGQTDFYMISPLLC
jgi:hypothetical protein